MAKSKSKTDSVSGTLPNGTKVTVTKELGEKLGVKTSTSTKKSDS